MTFDLSPMQPTASPITLLGGQQGPSPSDGFSQLLDMGTPAGGNSSPGQTPAQPIEPVESPAAIAPARSNPVQPALAIAHADALVSALTPIAKAITTLSEPRIEPQTDPLPAFQIAAAPTLVRPVWKRFSSLPPEPTEEATKQEKDPEQDAGVSAQVTSIAQDAPTPLLVAALDAPLHPPVHGDFQPSESLASLPVQPSVTAAAPSPTAPADNQAPSFAATSVEAEGAARIQPSPPATDQVTSHEHIQALAQSAIANLQVVTDPEPAILAASLPAAVLVSHDKPVGPAEATFVSVPIAATGQAIGPVQPKTAQTHLPKADEPIVDVIDVPSIPLPTMPNKSGSDAPVSVQPSAHVNAAAAVSGPDAIIDRQLDLVRNDRWLGELARDIASTSGNNERLSFRLMPHQLGRLDVDVSRSHNGLTLAIHTETESARTILTAAQPRLADEMRANGLKLADAQMFSGDARQSHDPRSGSRPTPLIETFAPPPETVAAPEQAQRSGRYA